jgi:hypothetical protein
MRFFYLKYILKWSLILLSSIVTSTSFAATTNLFTLYRTNYYPEKTYAYTLDYEAESCRITSHQANLFLFILLQRPLGQNLMVFQDTTKTILKPKV